MRSGQLQCILVKKVMSSRIRTPFYIFFPNSDYVVVVVVTCRRVWILGDTKANSILTKQLDSARTISETLWYEIDTYCIF